MLLNKKITVILALVAVVFIGIAASRPPADPQYKNLKILPKNITHDQLDSVMHFFNNSLGVKCNFCHASEKDNPRKMDFASDEKAEKNIAREMFRMTGKINKKFFHYKWSTDQPIPPMTCFSCHHGNVHPDNKPAPRQRPENGGGPKPENGNLKPEGNN